MNENTDLNLKFARQLISFFQRTNSEVDLSSATKVIEELQLRLNEGHSSISIDPEKEEVEILKKHGVLGRPDEKKPLVLSANGDLYFRRYYEYELSIAKRIFQWSTEKTNPMVSDYTQLNRMLGDDPDQLQAAKLSLENRFSVITGGPGTGKTYLLVAILSSLARNNPSLNVTLAAPTGKAAQRMSESIQLNLKNLSISEEEKQAIPQKASTIHRLLKPLPPSIHFRQNQKHPLQTDFVIIDEASMVDLPLMAKLMDAIPQDCRLLLVGDVDQLAPVEAGSPFASIIRYFQRPERPQLVAKLSTSRRFGQASSIHQLCQSITRGDSAGVDQLLSAGNHLDLEFSETTQKEEIDRLILRGYESLQLAKTPEEALKSFLEFQVLCPSHHGERGVIAMNERIHSLISKNLVVKNTRFSGMPIIIKQNDYSSGLFNGDIGIFLPKNEHSQELTVWFANSDGSLRNLSPARLPEYDLAYAITIHRSQGSEYKNVFLLMPENKSEVLSRHLLYVACSRAKEKVFIHGNKNLILETIEKATLYSQSLENRMYELCEVH